MEIKHFEAQHLKSACALWNKEGSKYHYKPLTEEQFMETFIQHPYYDEACVFVALDQDRVIGFAAGVTSKGIPLGDVAGYITTVVMEPEATNEQFDEMIAALEQRFIECGKKQAELLFFNPVKLIWTMPSAPKHEHNNAPGILREFPLYERLVARGYTDRATQCGMYLPLGSFQIPQAIQEKEARAKEKGYDFVFYNETEHSGIDELLEALDNPQWIKEVALITKQGAPLPIAVKDGVCVGFAGPIIRQDNGRAFFCGVGVHPQHEGHGLGSILFNKMVEAFQNANCDYITLFTGKTNPALKIYEKAGFRIEKEFAILRKELN